MTNPAFRWKQTPRGDIEAHLAAYRVLRHDVDLGAIVRALLDLRHERPAGRFAWMWPAITTYPRPDGSVRYRILIRSVPPETDPLLGNPADAAPPGVVRVLTPVATDPVARPADPSLLCRITGGA